MARIDLNVPFHEKDAAKALGARWDPQRRLWYAPDGVDNSQLSKWMSVAESPNIRAETYFLAHATRDCWSCSSPTRVFGIILPAGYEVLYVEDDPSDDYWETAEEPTILSYVTFLAHPTPARLGKLAPLYKTDHSRTIQSSYWMNHCDRCGVKLGDFDTIEECGAALSPVTLEDAAKVQLYKVSEPLLASCGGHTCGVPLFEYFRSSRF